MIEKTVFTKVNEAADKEIKELTQTMLENEKKNSEFSGYDVQQMYFLQNINSILEEIEQFDADNEEVQSKPYNQTYVLSGQAVDVVNNMLDVEYQNSWFADSITDLPENDWYYSFLDFLTVSK